MAFDPKPYFLRLKGKDYLPVAARLAWLREEHPEAHSTTELLQHDRGSYALFRATITIPNGGSATGWGSETVEDFGDYLEKAETKALGRAVAALGYGTLHALELDEGDSVADTPIAPRRAPATITATSSVMEPIRPAPDADPDLEAARAALKAARAEHDWSLQRIVETAALVWPHITSPADLGTLTTVQLNRLTEVVTGESVIRADDRGTRRIMPAAVAIGAA